MISSKIAFTIQCLLQALLCTWTFRNDFLSNLLANYDWYVISDHLANWLALSKSHPYIVIARMKCFRSKIHNPKSNHFVVESGDGVPAIHITSITTGVWWRFNQLLIIFFSSKTSCTTNMNYEKHKWEIGAMLSALITFWYIVFYSGMDKLIALRKTLAHRPQ